MSFVYRSREFKIETILDEELERFEEFQFLKIIETLLPSCSVSLDIGANIGNHSIFMSKILQCSIIHAFEPIPFLYDKMIENFNNNGVDNVISHNIALSSKESNLRCISKLPDNHGSYWLWYDGESVKHPYERGYERHKGFDGSEYTKQIPSKRLDDVMIEYNTDKIHFIKIDVEGMEIEVLNGGMDIIQKHKPLLQIEVSKDNFELINTLLKSLGYIRINKDVFKWENQLWIHI